MKMKPFNMMNNHWAVHHRCNPTMTKKHHRQFIHKLFYYTVTDSNLIELITISFSFFSLSLFLFIIAFHYITHTYTYTHIHSHTLTHTFSLSFFLSKNKTFSLFFHYHFVDCNNRFLVLSVFWMLGFFCFCAYTIYGKKCLLFNCFDWCIRRWRWTNWMRVTWRTKFDLSRRFTQAKI